LTKLDFSDIPALVGPVWSLSVPSGQPALPAARAQTCPQL